MRLLTSRSLAQTQLGEILCAAHHPEAAQKTRLHGGSSFSSPDIGFYISFQDVQDCSGLHQQRVRGGRTAGHLAACSQRTLMIVLGLFLSCCVSIIFCLRDVKQARFHMRAYKATRVDGGAARVSVFIVKTGRSQADAVVACRFFRSVQRFTIRPEDCLIDLIHGRFKQKRVAAWRSVC